MKTNMDLYDFEDFLKQIQELNLYYIIKVANEKCASLEQGAYGMKGSIKKRRFGAIDLAEKIKGLLFWLQNGVKPTGLTESDFQLLKPLCMKLIEKKQFKEEALEIFN